ncbi:hypothetical protein [Helicobacter ailurogastricus]|uniref:Uncharacterized protein n=1 Tax=Helicobacter ailurogastricus TaxID=1578720 RepID=A0A0K2Y3X0_9HELI|nr:hypothetical protein [Helicobacter ailurogastricus]BDQ29683.1 hypothetical protein ASB7_15200 [Helicobacter ailurogastricus]CRF52544.1 hypothetical protein HAL07_10090 [Helicobacter ailurogastricus]
MAGIGAITATQDTEILKALCEVFGIDADLQMIQEVLEDRKRMEEQEKSQTELETQKQTLIVGKRLKSYTALKNKFFNAQDLESGIAILKELHVDYFELLEPDKFAILDYIQADMDNYKKNDPTRHVKVVLLLHFYFSPVFGHTEPSSSMCYYFSIFDNLNQLAELLGRKVHTIVLDFDDLKIKPHDFGKIVCFESELWNKFDDECFTNGDDEPLRCTGNNLFFTRTLKIAASGDQLNGKHTLRYVKFGL